MAIILIKQHGSGAIIFAMHKTLGLRAAGDDAGADYWLRLYEAILDLSDGAANENDTIN